MIMGSSWLYTRRKEQRHLRFEGIIYLVNMREVVRDWWGTVLRIDICQMSITNSGKRLIRPTHPGEMLREDFIPEYGLIVSSLAGLLPFCSGPDCGLKSARQYRLCLGYMLDLPFFFSNRHSCFHSLMQIFT
jgi:hypothetical protein